MDIKDKVAVVTGASSGIGEATALMLAKAGAKVTIAARREEKLNSLKEKIEKEGGSALVVPTDVTDKKAVENMIRKTKDQFGSVDILINNAGIMPLSFMKNLKTDEWEKMVDVNIKGVLNSIGATLPIMREQKSGHIINISSVAGRRVMPGSAVYSATKFAVRALSEGMRMELSATDNIKVTSIEPGAVETELPNTITDDEIMESFQKIKELTMLQSEDIAKSIVYAIEQADRVNVNEIMIMPAEQQQ